MPASAAKRFLAREKNREKFESSHSQEDLNPPPVPPGNVRICGHFTGSITTASHHLDVSLPVKYTVPYVSIEPCLSAFFHASKKETADGDGSVGHGGHEGSCAMPGHTDKHGGGMAARVEPWKKSELWKKLKALCHVDMQSAHGGDDPFPRQISGTSGDVSMCRQISTLSAPEAIEELEKMAHKIEELEEHDTVLEIDYEAKEALLQEVFQERDDLLGERFRLQFELDALKNKLPANSKNQSLMKRTLTSPLSHFLSDRTLSPKSQPLAIRKVRTEQFSRPSENTDFDDAEDPHFENIEFGAGHRATLSPDDHKVPRGELVLEGSFEGKVRTGLHLLDVVLPVEGRVPGPALVGLAHALEKSSLMDEAPRSERNIWGKLVHVLTADLKVLEDSCEAT